MGAINQPLCTVLHPPPAPFRGAWGFREAGTFFNVARAHAGNLTFDDDDDDDGDGRWNSGLINRGTLI